MAGGYKDDLAEGSDSLPSAFEGLASGLSGRGNRASSSTIGPSAFGWQDGADHGSVGAERTLPGLHQEERLPWLYSAQDELDEAGVDPARVWAFVLTGFALLVLIVGGVWWTTHRRDGGAQQADGSLIAAPPGPIKEAPQDPGGKTFDGTGDSSFAVSQGHVPGAILANSGDQADGEPAIGVAQPPTAKPDADSADTAVAGAGKSSGGIGVQVGAFSTQLAAEGAWAHLAKAYDALSGTSHRIVEGKADIGTVYGLQAVTGSDAAANALCDRLKAAGLNCQVKD
jgi:hypothetical protein